MKPSTIIALAVGGVVLLILGLAIAKAMTPRPKTLTEQALGGWLGYLAL